MEVFALSIKLKEEGAAAVQKATERLGGALKSVNLASILAGAGLVQMGRAAIGMADEMRLLESRLKLVTSSASELQFVQDALRASATATRSDYAASVELFARVARSTRDLGLAQSDLLKFTELTQMAIKSSGASSVEASAALIQLSQGLASGTLRGDEFRSVMEQIPGLALQIASGLGVGVGELRKLAMEGQLTGQQVVGAVLKMEQAIRGDFAEAPVTVADGFVLLKNAVRDALATINNAAGITSGLASGLTTIAPMLGDIAKALVGVGGAIMDYALPALTTFGGAWVALNLTSIVGLVGTLGARLVTLAGALNGAAFAQTALNIAMNANQVGVLIAGFGALTGVILSFAKMSEKAAEARDEAVAKSPEYLAALKAVQQRTEERTKAEADAARAMQAVTMATKTRINDLLALSNLTDLTRGQFAELTRESERLAAEMRNGNLPLSERVKLLERQLDLLDALSIATIQGESARMAAIGGQRGANAGVGRPAAGGIAPPTLGTGLMDSIKKTGQDARNAMQAEADALAVDLQTSFAQGITNGIGDGIASGFAALTAPGGTIGKAFNSFAGMMLGALGDAMIRFGLASKGFAALQEKIMNSLATLNPKGALIASVALVAMGGALKGAAAGMFQRGTGGAGITSIGSSGGGGTGGQGDGTVTRLIFGQTSATTAAGMQPRQATNVTIIGPDDPKAQRAIEELITKGQRRGTLG